MGIAWPFKTLSVHDVGLKDMVEALYLQDKLPELHLITVSIEEIHPMTMTMTKNVENCIAKTIETVLELAKEIHSKMN